MLLGNLGNSRSFFTTWNNIETLSNNDGNMDYDVYDRLRPGTRLSSTAGNTNT